MKRILAGLALTICMIAGVQAQEGQPVQVFACELNEGKTVDNVMALADAYRTAWPMMNIADEGAGAFVWTSFREGTPYDYVVGFINSSLEDLTAGLDSYYGSGLGQGLDAQFLETGNCISGIVFSEQIRNGTIGQTGDDQPDAVVETFACNINEGSDMEDVIAAEEYWRGRVDALNSPAVNQFEAYRWTLYRGGTGESDFTWVGNYPDMATWARGETDWLASKEGQAADERIERVTTCVSGMWLGYWIVPPAAGPTAE